MRISTDRLVLDPVDVEEAHRIHDGTPAATDRWAADYPFDGDRAGIGAFLRATAEHGEQQPFGYYRISLRDGEVAIGGIGFKGRPQDGVAEVGYGLVPSARGHGYATEALRAVVDLARSLRLDAVQADTDHENLASQRVLEKAGFHLIREDAEARWYEIRFGR